MAEAAISSEAVAIPVKNMTDTKTKAAAIPQNFFLPTVTNIHTAPAYRCISIYTDGNPCLFYEFFGLDRLVKQ